MTLRESIKNAASVSATVPVAEADRAYDRLRKQKHSGVMPWGSGRKPVKRKQDAVLANTMQEPPSEDLKRRRMRRLMLAKKRSYPGDEKAAGLYSGYSGMGGNFAAPIYNKLIDYSIKTFNPMNTVSGVMGNPFARSTGATGQQSAPQQQQARYDRNTSFSGLVRDPRGFADSVLGRYNQQSWLGRRMSNVGTAAFPVSTTALHAVGAGGSGPGPIAQALAIPATIAARGKDRVYINEQERDGFQRMMRQGMEIDAKERYPDIYKRWSQGARGEKLAPWWLR